MATTVKRVGPEKAYENEIKDELKKRGAWYVKYWAGAMYTRSGVPDLLVCYKGNFLAIEVKGDQGVISDTQRAEMAKIEASGGIGRFTRPYNKNALWALFDALDANLQVGQHGEDDKPKKARKTKQDAATT